MRSGSVSRRAIKVNPEAAQGVHPGVQGLHGADGEVGGDVCFQGRGGVESDAALQQCVRMRKAANSQLRRDHCRVLGVSMGGYGRWHREPVGPPSRSSASTRTRTPCSGSCACSASGRACAGSPSRTKDSGLRLPPALDLVERRHSAKGPDPPWPCGVTYVPTSEGFRYLSAVIAAWAISALRGSKRGTAGSDDTSYRVFILDG